MKSYLITLLLTSKSIFPKPQNFNNLLDFAKNLDLAEKYLETNHHEDKGDDKKKKKKSVGPSEHTKHTHTKLTFQKRHANLATPMDFGGDPFGHYGVDVNYAFTPFYRKRENYYNLPKTSALSGLGANDLTYNFVPFLQKRKRNLPLESFENVLGENNNVPHTSPFLRYRPYYDSPILSVDSFALKKKRKRSNLALPELSHEDYASNYGSHFHSNYRSPLEDVDAMYKLGMVPI